MAPNVSLSLSSDDDGVFVFTLAKLLDFTDFRLAGFCGVVPSALSSSPSLFDQSASFLHVLLVLVLVVFPRTDR